MTLPECGATTPLPEAYVAAHRVLRGIDLSGVVVACQASPHDDGDHCGPVVVNGRETRIYHYWTANTA
ncbi:hypothetical protein [Streptomyces sennicomposti]